MRVTCFVALLIMAGCGEDESEPEEIPIVPEMEFELTIEPGPEPDLNVDFDSDTRTSVHLEEGEVLHGRRYVVPDILCLRADGTDWNALPDEASSPGEPATFEVIDPLEGTDSGMLVFLPHGDGFEFIEALALGVYQKYPDVAAEFGVDPENGTRGVEQSTREGGRRNIVSNASSRNAIAMARLGATVIVPGNCWGDGGHGTGDSGEGYYEGPRLGGTFDHAVWSWAREEIDHEATREVAVGCSGGGHRIAEELVRDPDAFQAVIIDSPADDVSAFVENPQPELLGQVRLLLGDRVDEVMDLFFEGTFGGKDEAGRASLGHALPDGEISAPIYLIYSTLDPAVTEPVTRSVAEAVNDRGAPSVAVELDDEVHCQLNTDERMTDATDWLEGVLAE